MMPLLVAGAALLIALLTAFVTGGVVLIGWRRQDRVLRRMQQDLAERGRPIRTSDSARKL